MNTFLNFLSDNTFFAFFSGIIIVLVLVFIMTLVKGKKANQSPKEVTEENDLDKLNPLLDSLDTSDISSNPSNEIENQMLGSNNPDTGYQAAFTNYIPDLNETESKKIEIPSTEPYVNSEEITYNEPIIPENSEIITNNPNGISEENIGIIDNSIEIPAKITEDEANIPDFTTQLPIVNVEPISEAGENENIEMPSPITETPELAFASVPIADNSINENIQIEPSQEYNFEKTEIFDFPDFSKAEVDSEKILIDVEKVVMEAANKYIDSIMKS